MKNHRFFLLRLAVYVLVAGLVILEPGFACERCPVSIDLRSSVQLGWSQKQAEVCDVLTVPEMMTPADSRWGLGVAVLSADEIVYSEYHRHPFCIRKADTHGTRPQSLRYYPTRNAETHDQVRIEEMAWDPINNVLWGASRCEMTLNDPVRGCLSRTRIFTIEIDSTFGSHVGTSYAECTFRFEGLGVPGPGYPTTGLSFDPYMGPHGTLWQHLEDGGASYTPFPITADLGTTGPGEPVYVGGYPGYGQVAGICVSPSGKYMYVSHGIDGFISLHEKLTGAYIASLATGPRVPLRYLRGLEIDHSRPGCPRLLCTESQMGIPDEDWVPTILTIYPITDE